VERENILGGWNVMAVRASPSEVAMLVALLVLVVGVLAREEERSTR
jgi:hypothetical protein